MIFRLSQKLCKRVKADELDSLPLDENPLADWSAHLFSADRVKYILICNTKSLYSTVTYAKGVTDDGIFIKRALASLREFMRDDGQEPIYQNLISPAGATVRFAKALDRSVTGSMNDLVYHATMCLIEREMSPHDVGFDLNRMPMSALGYANPRDALMQVSRLV
jgi:phosphoribosyl-ATP pyrophosphohydrolase